MSIHRRDRGAKTARHPIVADNAAIATPAINEDGLSPKDLRELVAFFQILLEWDEERKRKEARTGESREP